MIPDKPIVLLYEEFLVHKITITHMYKIFVINYVTKTLIYIP